MGVRITRILPVLLLILSLAFGATASAYGGGVSGRTSFSSSGTSSGSSSSGSTSSSRSYSTGSTSSGSTSRTTTTYSYPTPVRSSGPTNVIVISSSSGNPPNYGSGYGSSGTYTSSTPASGSGGSFLGTLLVIILVSAVLVVGSYFLVMWVVNSRSATVKAQAVNESDGVDRHSPATLIDVKLAFLSNGRDVIESLRETTTRPDAMTESLSGYLAEICLILQRHREYLHGAAASFDHVPQASVETFWNQLTNRARTKLSYETITVLNGARRQRATKKVSDEPGDYLVVELMVATTQSFPGREALGSDAIDLLLTELAGITTAHLEAVEVVWQPDNDQEALSESDLIEQYPDILPI